MLDNILKNIKPQIEGQLKRNAGISEEQIPETMQLAGEAVCAIVKEEAATGNTEGLMHLFGSQEASASTTNPIVENIEAEFTNKLITKLGISSSVASTATNILMPYLIKAISAQFSSSATKNEEGLLAMFQGGQLAQPDTFKRKLEERLGDKLGGVF